MLYFWQSGVTALLMLNNNIGRAVMFEEQVLCIMLEVDGVIIYNNSAHPEMLNASYIICESSRRSDLLVRVCCCCGSSTVRADSNHVKSCWLSNTHLWGRVRTLYSTHAISMRSESLNYSVKWKEFPTDVHSHKCKSLADRPPLWM